MLKQVLRYTDNYRRSKNIQINWIEALEYKIVTQQQQEKQDSQLNNDIDFLKQAFNANKVWIRKLSKLKEKKYRERARVYNCNMLVNINVSHHWSFENRGQLLKNHETDKNKLE
jgi:hypothetical protein